MVAINNMAMQGVTLTPKFVFGCNGQINNCLYQIDEKKIVYVAGHNVIIYDPDEKSQFFIPGSSNADAISNISVSPSQKFMAICERGEVAAQCIIYDLENRKKIKTIPDAEVSEQILYQSHEFISCAFSVKNERQQIVTLCNEPDWLLMLWNWDRS